MDFTIDGDPVWFNGITGTVKGVQNWTSSNVNASGGGGVVTRDGGHIAPAQVTTTVDQHQRFWIATENGLEKEIDNPNFHCRDGHKVTLIWGADKGKETGGNVLFLNHNTGEITNLNLLVEYFQKITGGYKLIKILSIILCITIYGIPIGFPLYIYFSSKSNKIKHSIELEYRCFIKNLLQNRDFMQSIS